jgi:NADH-ubiquinone oxidoreductase chain 2
MITFAILILIVAKALPGLNTHISSIHVTRITSIVFLFAGALSLNSLNLESIGSGIGIYSGLFQVTTLSQLIEIFLFLIGGGILIAWPQIKQNLTFSLLPQLSLPPVREGVRETDPSRLLAGYLAKGGSKDKGTDYSIVVLFSSLGSSLLISSYDLISVYLSIELQSFGLYVLSTLYRDSESSTSAGLKYFLLGGLSSCIILLGTGIIYSYTGTTNLESLYIINSVIDALPFGLQASQQYIIQGISLGLSLIFIGFLFKIAAAPLHNWSPDVYDGTPTIVTIWLTIIPKIAILFILLELQVKLGTFGPLEGGLNTIFLDIVINNNILKTLLLISATLSLIIGSLLGLAQIKIKRLLAYSTISHVGFILLALAVNTEQSIDSFIFYIIQYTITNLNIFLIILGLTYCLNTYYTSLTIPSLAQQKGQIQSPHSIRRTLAPPVREEQTQALSLRISYCDRGEEPSLCNNPPHVGRREVETSTQLRQRGGVLISESLGEETANLTTALQGNKDISLIYEFKGLFFSNPLLSISLAVSLFSMAGIPPLIGFFSKQLVLYSALQNGYYFISVLAIIVSVISCSYYLQIIKVLFTEKLNIDSITPLPPSPKGREGVPDSLGQGEDTSPFALSEGIEKNEILLTNTHSYLISTLTFTILLFFIKPSLILNSTQLLSLSLFYI